MRRALAKRTRSRGAGQKGTRPSAPSDQRTTSTYIFGAICPKEGKGAALVLPHCNTEAMNLHLAEIATQVAPGAHGVLLLDQAGWHLSGRLVVPRSSRCRPNARNSIPWRSSGSLCATTGFRTVSSNLTKTSSITAATPGTNSSTCLGKSCPSASATGPCGSNQRELVLVGSEAFEGNEMIRMGLILGFIMSLALIFAAY